MIHAGAKPLFSISLIACLFVTSAFLQPPSATAQHPNVIQVMADDLGIGDISPTNPECKIKTPSLQKFASAGMTFMDAHTPSSVCTPTRYGLLTGRYNWRSRLAEGVLSGTSKHLIPADRATLGHLMKSSGYHTAMIGKWHLGWDWKKKGKEIDFTQPVENGPDINGFDQYYGHCGSLDMSPYVWVDTGKPTSVPTRKEGVTRDEDRYGWYRKGPIGDDFEIPKVLPHLFDKSIEYVKQRSEKAREGKPFFLYLPLPAPHTPIVPVAPFKDASGINPYADFVMQMDHHFGELMKTLEAEGVAENTLVIFTSDNGCSPQANFELLKGKGHSPSSIYRGHKADIFEGGHRVPFIVRWPGKVEGGKSTKALACLTDVYATLREITGQSVQPNGGEDSISLVPVLKGESETERKNLVSHSIRGKFAIREGAWKLCLAPGSGGWSSPRDPVAEKKGLPPMQLFNLDEDPGEKNNLVAKEENRVDELLLLLAKQVEDGRSSEGDSVKNDREVEFLPQGVKMPEPATAKLP